MWGHKFHNRPSCDRHEGVTVACSLLSSEGTWTDSAPDGEASCQRDIDTPGQHTGARPG